MGEKLNYTGYFGPLEVGYSWMKIDTTESSETPAGYKIESLQKTRGLFALFFYLEDYYCSYVEPNTFNSQRFIKKIHEGDYENELILDFNEDSVFYNDGRRVSKIKNAKDIFAAIYYLRNLSLSPGDTLNVPFHTSGKNYNMKVPVSGPVEIDVPAGTFKTYLIEPGVPEGKIFSSKEPLKIWITVDKKHIPVKIKTRLSVGNIIFALKSIEVSGGKM